MNEPLFAISFGYGTERWEAVAEVYLWKNVPGVLRTTFCWWTVRQRPGIDKKPRHAFILFGLSLLSLDIELFIIGEEL